MSVYAGSPLLRGTPQIRLLKIDSSPGVQIDCTFTTFDLDAAPQYKALSYEWGPKPSTHAITIARLQTNIRSNLWNFLTKLKAHGYHDYLWCDAICIDQGNNLERNHQVQLMSQIYRKAKSVLLWLGEDDYNCGHLLRTLRSISDCKKNASRSTCSTERASILKALVHVSRRRYWTRIWIIQELTVARDIEIFCGGEKAPWPVFATACKFPPDIATSWASRLWALSQEILNDKR
jgi:hypothetical protein